MYLTTKCLGLIFLFVSLAQGAIDGTISGIVKDATGAPLKGAFVRSRNLKTKITVDVLSDKEGRYRAQNLPPGDYEIRATAIGYKDDLHSGVKLAAGDSASLDFALQKGIVRWSDLSEYQGWKLLPDGKGKEILFGECSACHGFQSRMAATRRDEEGWARAVNLMRGIAHAQLWSLSDQDWANVGSYLNSTFGMESGLPRSPAELPAYKETVRSFSDEAMKIVYVEYEMPGPNRMPFSGAPDRDGNVWIPEIGWANKIARLDPITGMMQEFPVPNQGPAGIHSAVPAPDGTVWLAEQSTNKLGKWDPNLKDIREYQDSYLPGFEGIIKGGQKHTVRVDLNGNVWATGIPLTRFDPKTEKFTHFPEVAGLYDIAFDKDGNVWFTQTKPDYKIGRLDAKTGKVMTWETPTPKSYPRRLQIDSQGIVWFGEYLGGKIGRFDPRTETFKEFQVPGGPSSTPYAIGIDRNDNIWYSSDKLDVLGRLDPKTGKITEYPFPYSENFLKEFFMDSQGRMWFGSAPNNKVGYFVLPAGN